MKDYQIQSAKANYPAGTRVELISMENESGMGKYIIKTISSENITTVLNVRSLQKENFSNLKIGASTSNCPVMSF